MKYLDYVKIVKLGPVEDPYVDTPTTEEYEQNKIGKTIPTDYTLEGYLAGNSPTLGYRVVVDRRIRNGVKIRGYFQTSVVKKIVEESPERVVFETENSRYIAETEEVSSEDV